MIEMNLLRGWTGIVESAALLAIIVLAVAVMVRAVTPSEAIRHLGAVLCLVILLIMLPAILMSAWDSMSFLQHLGIIALLLIVAFSLIGKRQATKRRRRREWR